jgi:hypothetical protein
MKLLEGRLKNDGAADWIGTPDRLNELLEVADVLLISASLSRALRNSAASPDRRSFAVLCVKSAPALHSASARAAPWSSARYMMALAPASPSATIDLRLSLSSKATTSGGGLNFMRPRDYTGSARETAPPPPISVLCGLPSHPGVPPLISPRNSDAQKRTPTSTICKRLRDRWCAIATRPNEILYEKKFTKKLKRSDQKLLAMTWRH